MSTVLGKHCAVRFGRWQVGIFIPVIGKGGKGMSRCVQKDGPCENPSSSVMGKSGERIAMRIIQRSDLLPLADMGNQQLWMVQDIVDSVNTEIELGNMTVHQITEVLERLTAILKGKIR